MQLVIYTKKTNYIGTIQTTIILLMTIIIGLFLQNLKYTYELNVFDGL